VQTNASGQVVLKLKTPRRDGTTHLVMSPLEFMQRLAALMPRPRLHLIRFHGVLAPSAKLRARAARYPGPQSGPPVMRHPSFTPLPLPASTVDSLLNGAAFCYRFKGSRVEAWPAQE
jgi:hypothetical protein